MTLEEFSQADEVALPPALRALWWDAQGEWETAHEIAQEIEGPDGAWVHAYLHRKERSAANAAYWYAKAGRPVATGDSRSEWQEMVTEMLGRG